MSPETPLSLEGLAAILERHIEHTHDSFERVHNQIAELAGQVESLTGLMREQGLRITTLAEQQAEQQLQIRQMLHRLEQHDARFEEQNGHIRRILDLLQHRGGDGASGTQ